MRRGASALVALALLAAGCGPIYQLCRAFRDGEAGSRHNPEFSLLEWYRPGYDLSALMQEVAELLQTCLGDKPTQLFSYRELFMDKLDIDPFSADIAALQQRAAAVVAGIAEGCRQAFEENPQKFLEPKPRKRKGIWGRYMDRLQKRHLRR